MSIFPSEDWIHAEAEADGNREILRVRATSPSVENQSIYGMLVVVKWQYKPETDGLPNTADRDDMKEFEAAILSGTEERRVGYLVSSLTGNGQKEWRYYAINAEEFISSLNNDLGHPSSTPNAVSP